MVLNNLLDAYESALDAISAMCARKTTNPPMRELVVTQLKNASKVAYEIGDIDTLLDVCNFCDRYEREDSREFGISL